MTTILAWRNKLYCSPISLTMCIVSYKLFLYWTLSVRSLQCLSGSQCKTRKGLTRISNVLLVNLYLASSEQLYNN